MVWKKTASNYVANWQMFELSPTSLAKLAAISMLCGLLWGVLVVKFHGLPGDDAREVESNWNRKRAEAARLVDKICQEHPHSGACKNGNKPASGSIDAMK